MINKPLHEVAEHEATAAITHYDNDRSNMEDLPSNAHSEKIPQIARRARIYSSSHDHHGPQPLFTAIVTKARQARLAGATVFKGIEGFGVHDQVHTSGIIDIASESPIVIELIDTVEKIDVFIMEIQEWVGAAMITVEDVNVVYRAAKAP